MIIRGEVTSEELLHAVQDVENGWDKSGFYQ